MEAIIIVSIFYTNYSNPLSSNCYNKNNMLTPLEKHYNKHKEDLRLQRQHGQIEFRISMLFILKHLPSNKPKNEIKILDLGTGRYSIELKNMGYNVTAVELVQHNIDIMLKNDPSVKVFKGNAIDLNFLPENEFDAVISFGPMYHLMTKKEKLQAINQTKRVMKDDAILFQAYLLNDYSLITYCFQENRMPDLYKRGIIDENFIIHPSTDELYDYVSLDSITELNQETNMKRVTIFSPDGPTDYMRPVINKMTPESFELFIKYQLSRAERPELLGASSHIVDIVIKDKR